MSQEVSKCLVNGLDPTYTLYISYMCVIGVKTYLLTFY